MEKVPFVTLVMPIRNEAAFIKRSLGAVLAQDYPRERMEVLIADVCPQTGLEMSLLRLAATHSDISCDGIGQSRRLCPQE